MDIDIIALRAELRVADSLHLKLSTFAKLLAHPDIAWDDLVTALSIAGAVSDQASIYLHDKLNIDASSGFNHDANFWLDLLQDQKISPDAKCGVSARSVIITDEQIKGDKDSMR